jgi:hypothetical protein
MFYYGMRLMGETGQWWWKMVGIWDEHQSLKNNKMKDVESKNEKFWHKIAKISFLKIFQPERRGMKDKLQGEGGRVLPEMAKAAHWIKKLRTY